MRSTSSGLPDRNALLVGTISLALKSSRSARPPGMSGSHERALRDAPVSGAQRFDRRQPFAIVDQTAVDEDDRRSFSDVYVMEINAVHMDVMQAGRGRPALNECHRREKRDRGSTKLFHSA